MSQKRLELTGLATDESLNNFARSDVESQSRCHHLTNAFGGMGTLGIDWAFMMTMQPSLTHKDNPTKKYPRQEGYYEGQQNHLYAIYEEHARAVNTVQ